jgi:hypothetical protein
MLLASANFLHFDHLGQIGKKLGYDSPLMIDFQVSSDLVHIEDSHHCFSLVEKCLIFENLQKH